MKPRSPVARGSAAMHRLAKGDVVNAMAPVNAFTARRLVGVASGASSGEASESPPLLSMGRHAVQRGHSALRAALLRPDHPNMQRSAACWPTVHCIARRLPFRHRARRHVALPSQGAAARRGAAMHTFMSVAPCPSWTKLGGSRLAASIWPASTGNTSTPPALCAGDRRIVEKPARFRLARSGRTLDVPADKSILQVLIEDGVTMEWSCMEGASVVCARHGCWKASPIIVTTC